MKQKKQQFSIPFVFEVVVNRDNLYYEVELNRPEKGNYKVDYYGTCDNPDCFFMEKRFHGDFSCYFQKAGTYRIALHGSFPGFLFSDLVYSCFMEYMPCDCTLCSKDIDMTLDEYLDEYDGFYGLYIKDIICWGTNVWQRVDGMFKSCRCLHISAADAPDLSQVTSMDKMFEGCRFLNSDIGHWDVSNITSMFGTFSSALHFNKPLNHWNVSNVQNMMQMFSFATSFNQSLNHWNVSNVKSMEHMFSGAKAFDKPLAQWDISHVEDMWGMFEMADSFKQKLDNWDASSVDSGECSWLSENMKIVNGKVVVSP